MLSVMNPKHTHAAIKVTSTYAPWNDDPAFNEVYRLIHKLTLIDVYRLWELWTLVQKSAALQSGCLVEVGCWKGGSTVVIGKAARLSSIKEPLFVFDTFGGIPASMVGPADPHYRGGEHGGVTKDEIFKRLALHGVKNFQLFEGTFPHFNPFGPFHPIRFAHLDVDVYESAKQCTEAIFSRLVPGGMIVYDDYGFPTTPGVTRYVNELAANTRYPVIHNLNGHAILIKT
jgi:O-methyltransferase